MMLKELLSQMRQSIRGNNNSSIVGDDNHIGDKNYTTNIYDTTKRLPSDLAEIINILGKTPVSLCEDINIEVVKPEIKINHNNIIEYKEIITEYRIWSGILATIYKQCEEKGTNRTDNMLSNIRQHYMKVKGELLRLFPGVLPLDVVRNNADDIFKKVELRLYDEIATSSNINSSKEELNKGLQVIIVDAFIRCQILERPTDATSSKH